MTIYADQLGKCYNQSETGFYRLYRENGKADGMFAIYLVCQEILWDKMTADATEVVYGERLEATFGGYLSDPANFEYGVNELKAELAYL